MRKLFLPVIILLGIMIFPGCSLGKGSPVSQRKSFFLMDTLVEVEIFSDKSSAQVAFDKVLATISELEEVLSSHLPGSDIAKLTAKAGIEPLPVSPVTLEVIDLSLDYAQRTGGAFDITVAPILSLYDFSSALKQRPTAAQLDEKLPLVDWRRIKLDHDAGTVFLTERGMQVDLGGVAKGFIVDRCLDALRESGIDTGLVNAGGDAGFLSAKPDGSPWRVGIKNPDHPETLFALVEIGCGAVATSGDYERCFIADGITFHHIIDPRTGLPADKSRSVTILADRVSVADLLATAVFVLGPDQGLALIESLPNVEAVIWDADDAVHHSSGLVSVPSSTIDYHFRRP